MTLDPARLDRLPRWARQHIRDLTRERDDARALAADAPTTTDYRAPGLHLGFHLEEHTLVPLDNANGMRLVLADGQSFMIQLDDDSVTIGHTDQISRHLVIQPRASNSITLTVTKDQP